MAYNFSRMIRHDGLNKVRVVKAATQYELEQKVYAIQAQWNEQWERKCEAERKRQEKLERIKSSEDAIKFASERTENAEDLQAQLDKILINSIGLQRFDIESLKDKSPYPVRKPCKKNIISIPREPQREDLKYNPPMPFWTKLFKSKQTAFIENNNAIFIDDHLGWERNREAIEMTNRENEETYNKAMDEWEKGQKSFLSEQAEKNSEIDVFKEDYKNGSADAIERYYLTALRKINIPIDYEKEFSIEYNTENKLLIVDALFPLVENIPNLKKVTYVKSREEYTETYYPESYMKKKYDSVLYQLVLSYINYIFEADKQYDFIGSVAINGIVNTIDKSTGKEIMPCILSVTVSKQDFEGLNLSAIDARAWFKSAKGVSAASFATMTPVVPIITTSREDSRFIDAYSVVDEIDDSVNLAAIDWKDFENLIREIFEKEFNVNGGEVKITQASRDGGVDAVAFDPDPIRGGKIVIQAKRYTNTVGVSAVRDLYGTVMNEGATKGILVTTSNYGSDAYSFANGKPLTLLNGGELLYLMEKHGHRAKIDLKEAKEFLKSQEK